jgi:hypothetical protein
LILVLTVFRKKWNLRKERLAHFIPFGRFENVWPLPNPFLKTL